MDVSVETIDTLKRRVSVSIPTKRVDEQVQRRLKDLANDISLPGFRRGHVPMSLVKQKYLASVRAEVAQNLIEETLPEVLRTQSLAPVGTPSIEKLDMEQGQDLSYIVGFEVLPEIEIVEPNEKITVDWIKSEVKSTDVDAMILKLQEQNKIWHPVDRKAQLKDELVIDFDGSIDGKPIEQGKSTDFTIELGSNKMIHGFEDALVGHGVGETFTIDVTFPENYQTEALAGKPAKFIIKISQINEGTLPELNKDFVETFGIDSGKIEDLRSDIEGNMQRELMRRLREINHDACFTKFADNNPFELPMTLVDKEIENLKHEMFHRMFGNKHSANEKIPDFPRELFEDRAKKRVHFGLLLSAYVKKHSLIAHIEEIEELMERIATAYDDPEEFKQKCRADKHLMAELEFMIVENQVAEKIRTLATVEEKELNYQEVMERKVS